MKRLTYILAGLALTLSACNNEKKETAKAPAMPMMMQSFETVAIQKSNPRVSLKLAGELLADQETELYAKVNSYVQKINVDIGDKVSSGQVLMVLDAPEVQAQLATAKSKLNAQEAIYIATKANYDRMFDADKTEGAISKDALDQITAKKLADEAQVNAARSVYNELKAMNNYLVIRAPFSGTVTDRNVDLGAYVGPMGKAADNPLLVIQNNNKLRLSLSVPEASTPYLNIGDTIRFRVKSIPQKMYAAKISRKSGALDMKLRSEKIEADLMNVTQELKPLMVAETNIPLQAGQATFFIPKTALVDANLGIYVIRVENGKTKNVPVAKGRMMPDKVEIFGELSEGDNILLKASEEIEEGTQIKK
ncbi:efflux RND transporter periplasmic adaptor subunit [Pedobacter caeni]|uniref:RND family efflux transporter, MFP subunit n=1 Tax=Pedobacter caeni TaxID=288992 RepID=A0A1M5DR09_9SPHI|nr:efflux RND transporter periplasmic adaptor subunit [Pedobacter caeni]SHF69356.1 RND family efflux transporter, MFP subunit [Pedobacter caeni]